MLHQYYLILNKVGIWFIKYKIQLDSTDLFHCAHRFRQKITFFIRTILSLLLLLQLLLLSLVLVSFRPLSHSSFICSSFNLVYVANCGKWCGTVLAMKWLPTESQMDSIFFILGLSVYFLICSYHKNVIRHDYMYLWYVSKIMINFIIDFKTWYIVSLVYS